MEITGSMISSGKLFTKLVNMPNMTNKDERYISMEDMKEIASETVTNLVATVTRDSSYINTGDEVSLSELVEHVLTRNEVRTDTFEPILGWQMSRPSRVMGDQLRYLGLLGDLQQARLDNRFHRLSGRFDALVA